MTIYLLTIHHYQSNTWEVVGAYKKRLDAVKQMDKEIDNMFKDIEELNMYTNHHPRHALQYLRDYYDTDISIQDVEYTA